MRFLDFYRTLDRFGRADFANRIGTSQAYLGQLAHGHRLPGMELAFRIVRESNGLVDAHEDSFGPAPTTITTPTPPHTPAEAA